MQIKLLNILSLLGAGDMHTTENIYSVLMEVLKRSDPGSNMGNAILYECSAQSQHLWQILRSLKWLPKSLDGFESGDNATSSS